MQKKKTEGIGETKAMTNRKILANTILYEIWKTKAWEIIMLRDRTYPDQKTFGNARAPDLFFNDIIQMKELRRTLDIAIKELEKAK